MSSPSELVAAIAGIAGIDSHEVLSKWAALSAADLVAARPGFMPAPLRAATDAAVLLIAAVLPNGNNIRSYCELPLGARKTEDIPRGHGHVPVDASVIGKLRMSHGLSTLKYETPLAEVIAHFITRSARGETFPDAPGPRRPILSIELFLPTPFARIRYGLDWLFADTAHFGCDQTVRDADDYRDSVVCASALKPTRTMVIDLDHDCIAAVAARLDIGQSKAA